MEASLFEHLDTGALVLTAHRRQARQLRYRYAAAKQARQVGAWESPRVHGWDDWLADLYEELAWSDHPVSRHRRRLLTPFQQRLLWQNIIGAGEQLAVDDISGTARTAAAAWTMLQAYRLPDPARVPHASADIEAFGQWMRRYFTRCRDQSLMDHARLADCLVPALGTGALPLPTRIVLLGFDALTPQQRGLLKTLETRGITVDAYRGAGLDAQVRRVQCDSDDDEYRAAARWVRAVLAAEGGGHAAVLVPRLAEHRGRIERIFDETLAPGSALPDARRAGRAYNMAVGDTFALAPLVVSALGVCEIVRGVVPYDTFSSMLRSSFWRGAAAEGALRARFDVWLRAQNIFRVPVDGIERLFGAFCRHQAPPAEASLTEGMLRRLRTAQAQRPATQRASHWADTFRAVLDACGWPGDSALDSASYQTAERWRALLDEMSGLDFLAPAMDAGQALALLRNLARSVSFQPQTPDLTVQVLLPDQAVGLHFDHLWWCGLHAGALPEAAAPNPFVPRHWQIDNQVPGGGAVVQLERAQRLTRRLLRAASDIVLSAPRLVDAHPTPMSALVSHVPLVEEGALVLANVTDYRDTVRASALLETFADLTGPPLAPDLDAATPGGSRLFALQASCPFRAFSELRLHAEPLVEPAPGLSARERGSLLHKALEAVWEKLGGLDTLRQLHGSDFLAAQVTELADEVLTRADRRRALPLAPRFRALEHQRMNRRVLSWLDVELTRAPFRVAGAEERRLLEIGGVTVKLSADRVDRLEDGALAVIDYKTGSASVGEWFGERPTQPQLPLYALAQSQPVAALAFAFVKPKKQGFAGISRDGGCLPGVDGWDRNYHGRRSGIDWDDLMAYWRRHLGALATHFAGGVAPVDPKAGACRYCHLASLCRIGAAIEPATEATALPAHEQDV